MEIKTSTKSGHVPVTVIQIKGSLDSSTYEAFHSRMNDLIDSGTRHILLDLAHAEFISSAGFRAFNSIFNRLRSLDPGAKLSEEELKREINEGLYKSPHLKLLNLSDNARTAFELAGFDLFIETFTDLKTAIASF
jgi:anti-anti-sigma factor